MRQISHKKRSKVKGNFARKTGESDGKRRLKIGGTYLWKASRHLPGIVANYFSSLHHEFNPLKFRDVLKRVAGNGDDVRELIFFYRTDFVLPPHHFRGHRGGCLDGLAR